MTDQFKPSPELMKALDTIAKLGKIMQPTDDDNDPIVRVRESDYITATKLSEDYGRRDAYFDIAAMLGIDDATREGVRAEIERLRRIESRMPSILDWPPVNITDGMPSEEYVEYLRHGTVGGLPVVVDETVAPGTMEMRTEKGGAHVYKTLDEIQQWFDDNGELVDEVAIRNTRKLTGRDSL